MAWTATIRLDNDKATATVKVGLATAIWNVGLADEFRYSERIKGQDPTDLDPFVASAKAALTARDARETKEANIVTSLETKLNA